MVDDQMQGLLGRDDGISLLGTLGEFISKVKPSTIFIMLGNTSDEYK